MNDIMNRRTDRKDHLPLHLHLGKYHLITEQEYSYLWMVHEQRMQLSKEKQTLEAHVREQDSEIAILTEELAIARQVIDTCKADSIERDLHQLN